MFPAPMAALQIALASSIRHSKIVIQNRKEIINKQIGVAIINSVYISYISYMSSHLDVIACKCISAIKNYS